MASVEDPVDQDNGDDAIDRDDFLNNRLQILNELAAAHMEEEDINTTSPLCPSILNTVLFMLKKPFLDDN